MIYQLIKKGKIEMEKVKEFVLNHKNEIIFVSTAVVAYRIGFKTGVKTVDKAITHLVKEAAKYVPEVH